MFEYAKKQGAPWGTVDTIPELPGVAVRFDGHVGVYVGNGQVIEERGFAYGCVLTELSKRKWTHWYQLPFITYNGSGDIKPLKLGDRVLRRGMTGTDVKELQTILKNLEYNIGSYGVDGDFGAATERALAEFQKDYGLEVTKITDEPTTAMLLNPVKPAPAPKPDEGATEHHCYATAKCNMHVRKEPNASSSSLGIIKKGTTVEVNSITDNQWLCINYKNSIGYTSNSNNEYYDIVEDSTVSEGQKYKTTGNVHLRVGAGTGYKSLTVIPKGSEVIAVGPAVISDGTPWYNIKYKNMIGYSSSKYLKEV